MITGDKNLAYQQNLSNRKISLIVLGTTRWGSLKEDLQPLVDAILRAKPNSYEQLPKPSYVARKKKGELCGVPDRLHEKGVGMITFTTRTQD